MKYGALKRLELFSALASPSQEKGLLHDYTKGCELKHNVNSSATATMPGGQHEVKQPCGYSLGLGAGVK